MATLSRVRSTFFIAGFAALYLSHVAVHAQLSTASINGTVRDSSGSVVPNTTVVLKNADTSVERTTVSNASGNYVFLNIIPGTYTLEARSTGFNTARVETF